ncbi:hypothetical protein E143388_08489 [Rhodococcus opacus]|nr:hypothetical protein E143388_08489 [Rhodococcus opacus]
MRSRASGAIEEPSAQMWCSTTASTCSLSAVSNKAARTGTDVVTSNSAEAIDSSRVASSFSVTAAVANPPLASAAGTTTWCGPVSDSG